MADARQERQFVRIDSAGTSRTSARTAGTGTHFVGRDGELATLGELLNRAVAHTTVVSVAGEPGIGKSRLIAECLRETGRQVLAAGSAEVALRVLLDRMADGRANRHRGLLAVNSVTAPHELADLRAGLAELVTEPSVLVLDDLHRCADEVLDLVQTLVAHPPAVPLVLLAGYRPGSAPDALFAALAGGIAGGTVTELVLGPLPPTALVQLTGQHELDVESFTECGGNPRWAQLAVGEAAVEMAVRAEIIALPPAQRALLQSLAVFGADADLPLLIAVSPPEDTAGLGALLGELTGTGLVVYDERTATARFRHPRVRELVYAGLDPAAKTAAHRKAARARHELGAPVEQRAAHLEHLGSDLARDDVRALLDAAREVLWRAPAAATRWLDAALRTRADRWPPEVDRATASILLGQAQALAGDLPAGRATLHEVLAGVRDIAPDQRWQAAVAGGLVERFLGRYPEASQVLAGAAEWLPAGEPAFGLAVERGAIALLDNNYPDAAGQVDAAARTSTMAAPAARASVLTMAGLGAASQMDITGARGYLDESAALVDAASDMVLLGSVETLSRQAWAESYLERFADAGRHFRRGIALAEGNGQAVLLPQLLLGESQILLWTRSLPAAQVACDRALKLAEGLGSDAIRSFALAMSAQLQTWSAEVGQSAHAVATAEEAVACANRRTLWGQTAVALLACAQVMAGQPDRCVATFLELAGGIELTEAQPMYRTLWYRTMTGAAVLAGDITRARDFAERAERHASAELASHRGLCAAARGDVLAATGRLEEALPEYRQAVRELDSCDWALQRDWTLAACGTLLVTFGQQAEAGTWLRRGRAGAERTGIRATLALADAALHGIEPVSADAPELRALTPRQREIVDLVLAGHSNRDVAGRLSLSARTVESHLANAYRSMGISSRTELLTVVAGQRIRPLPGDHRLSADLSPN